MYSFKEITAMGNKESFLRFSKQDTKRKTEIYLVYSVDGQDLGQVAWFASWRRYCFYPTMYTLFDTNCLKEIAVFIDGLMEERKHGSTNR